MTVERVPAIWPTWWREPIRTRFRRQARRDFRDLERQLTPSARRELDQLLDEQVLGR